MLDRREESGPSWIVLKTIQDGPDSSPVERALEELWMMSQSQIERERYEARLKWQRDVSTALAEARHDGLTEGRAEGRTEGRAEGRTEGRTEGLAEGRAEGLLQQVQLFQQLLGQPLTPAEELRLLPLSELEDQTRRLAAELASRLPPEG